MARASTKDWQVRRRERTHRLILLGGLVEKSGLLPLLGDDDPDATLLGGMMMLRRNLVEGDAVAWLQIWRRRGQRALRDVSEEQA